MFVRSSIGTVTSHAILMAIFVPAIAQDERPSQPAILSEARLDVPQTLVVATRQVPPFAMLNEGGQWEGISMDLFREVKADLESQAGHEIVVEFRIMDLAEMLAAVESQEVDIAVAALTVNFERERRMDFTHPYYTSGLGIAVGATQRLSGWSGLMDALFSITFLRIVIGLFLAMFASAVALYLFERKRNREQFDKGWVKGIAAGMWWAAVTLTTVGYGDKVPKTLGGRLIGLIWMFAGLFIIGGFTAAVTSTLTVTQLRARIDGPSDLARFKVATVDGSTSADYLRSRHINFAKHADVQGAAVGLVAGAHDAVVYDAPMLRYEVFQHHYGDAFVLPATFEKQNYAFALPTESKLREPINQVLLRKTSSPSWDQILASYLGDDQQ